MRSLLLSYEKKHMDFVAAIHYTSRRSTIHQMATRAPIASQVAHHRSTYNNTKPPIDDHNHDARQIRTWTNEERGAHENDTKTIPERVIPAPTTSPFDRNRVSASAVDRGLYDHTYTNTGIWIQACLFRPSKHHHHPRASEEGEQQGTRFASAGLARHTLSLCKFVSMMGSSATGGPLHSLFDHSLLSYSRIWVRASTGRQRRD